MSRHAAQAGADVDLTPLPGPDAAAAARALVALLNGGPPDACPRCGWTGYRQHAGRRTCACCDATWEVRS